MLDLRRPVYKQAAAYGHFGRNDIDLPWEKTNKLGELLEVVSILFYVGKPKKKIEADR